jgi:hypothetical protein
LLIAGAAVFVLSAIFWPSGNPVPHASGGPATMAPPSSSASAEPAPSAKLVDAANPAKLLDTDDLIKVTNTQFKLTSEAVPTSDKLYYGRSAVYTSQDKTYKPNSDNKPVTLTVITFIDDPSGAHFKELVSEAKSHNLYYRGVYTPDGDAGPDAFLSHDGTLTTHKGRVIVRLVAHDEERKVLSDTTITTLMAHILRDLDA